MAEQFYDEEAEKHRLKKQVDSKNSVRIYLIYLESLLY